MINLTINNLKELERLTDKNAHTKYEQVVKTYENKNVVGFHDALIDYNIACRLGERITIMKEMEQND